jgi:hypothetical protein
VAANDRKKNSANPKVAKEEKVLPIQSGNFTEEVGRSSRSKFEKRQSAEFEPNSIV